MHINIYFKYIHLCINFKLFIYIYHIYMPAREDKAPFEAFPKRVEAFVITATHIPLTDDSMVPSPPTPGGFSSSIVKATPHIPLK
jgi:hypothetical protein